VKCRGYRGTRQVCEANARFCSRLGAWPSRTSLSLAPLLLHARMTGKKFVAINNGAFVGIDAAAASDARNAISQNYDP